MPLKHIRAYNRANKVVHLDTYSPLGSQAHQYMEKSIILRLDYAASCLRAALRVVINEPEKWDKDFVLEMFDVECVCLRMCL